MNCNGFDFHRNRISRHRPWFFISLEPVDDDEINILPILICGDFKKFLGASSFEFLCDINIIFCVSVVDDNEHFSLLWPLKALIVEK